MKPVWTATSRYKLWLKVLCMGRGPIFESFTYFAISLVSDLAASLSITPFSSSIPFSFINNVQYFSAEDLN